jgi:hypothetical protein
MTIFTTSNKTQVKPNNHKRYGNKVKPNKPREHGKKVKFPSKSDEVRMAALACHQAGLESLHD